jgi:hypothetical protein
MSGVEVVVTKGAATVAAFNILDVAAICVE